MSRLQLCVLGLLVWALCAVVSAQEEQLVGSRHFRLTIAPTDKASEDAETADLYVTRYPGSGWRLVGSCQIKRKDDSVEFVREVKVPGDGVYYYIAMGNDGVGDAPTPEIKSKPQMKVIVDTTAPSVAITAPLSSEIFKPGQKAVIRWKAQDAEFGKKPIALNYSEDMGNTWYTLTRATENDGEEEWVIPPAPSGQLLLSLKAVDRVGNKAETVLGHGIRVATEKQAPVKPAVLTQEKPVQTVLVDDTPEPAPKEMMKDTAKEGGEFTPVDPKNVKPAEKPEHAWMDANDADVQKLDWHRYTKRHGAYVAWIYAGNLIRQGRVKDSLRYLRTAVTEDKTFDEAWNDAANVYKELGQFDKALESNLRAIEIEPENAHYLHTRGEIFQMRYHVQGMPRVTHEPILSFEQSNTARADVSSAVKYFGRAVTAAEKQGRLAERAASFFRLGEICYYVNHDPVGARQYWNKVLELHTPTPDLDNVIYDQGTPEEEKTRDIYAKYTHKRVELETWQSWARSYIDQLAQYEAQGKIQPAPKAGELNLWQTRPPYPPSSGATTGSTQNNAEVAMGSMTRQSEPAGDAAYNRQNYGSSLAHSDYIAPSTVADGGDDRSPYESDVKQRTKGRNFFSWPLRRKRKVEPHPSERYDTTKEVREWNPYQRRK